MRRKKKEDWKQHGYQKAETIQTSLDGEFYFVGKVLGFEPAEKHRKGRTHICKIHARSMSVEKDIRYELLARLCPNSTGAEIRSVGTEAGMFAIRVHRKMATEKDFLEAVNKVIKAYAKSSATPCYMTYNEINCSLIEMSTRESVQNLCLLTDLILNLSESLFVFMMFYFNLLNHGIFLIKYVVSVVFTFVSNLLHLDVPLQFKIIASQTSCRIAGNEYGHFI
ncbi:uncharacterized protein LOC129928733 [Biomphalaria glabrata]|uniref:Uncharacterized protein LOC129928733 n=1 Tax=Biomphalaria glabrata TaxID=6526 RepID=A0A9W3BLW5_BIOGL|nr:uncharacterized protein LOC129928733 [Biomphalaria glabrata]